MAIRKAKIICTIGPASDSGKMLTGLVKAGMDVARLNFSHGTHEEHLKKIKLIRDVSEKTGKPIAILQDLQGPKIRIGKFENPPIQLKTGDLFTITTDKILGNENIVSTSYKNLPNDVKPGDFILVNDGLIKLLVQEKKEPDVFCEVINGGSLYDRRGINLPGVKVSEPSLTEKDKNDLEFGLQHDVDYIALSFVRDAQSIREVKKYIGKKETPVIAKLEKPEALDNLDEIIAEADAVMVARGDLGVEISAERVPVVQKIIIEKCLEAGKPVITATQMLDSMMIQPVPTRAETSDVANAIFDGSDAVMLSGETAFGKYPLQSVKMMLSIILEAEKNKNFFRLNIAENAKRAQSTFAQSVAHAAYFSAKDIQAKYIVVLTRSGKAARVMSNFRPTVPVLGLSDTQKTIQELALLWGVIPGYFKHIIEISGDLRPLEDFLKEKNYAVTGDKIIVIAGSSQESGGTNIMRLHTIP